MHPILFHAGAITVPSYGVAVAFGLLFALLLAMWTSRQQGFNPNALWNLAITAVFTGAIAAKVWMLVTHFAAFRTAPVLLLNISALGSGEQALVSGLVATATLAWMCRRYGLSFSAALDALAAPALVLAAADSIGCLLAGCGYGTPSHGGWSLTYHSAYAFVWWGTPLGFPLRPVPILAASFDFALVLFLLWAGSWGLRTGRLAGIALASAACVHFLLQFWRGDVTPLGSLHLTPGQIVALLLLLCAVPLLWERKAWQYTASESTQ